MELTVKFSGLQQQKANLGSCAKSLSTYASRVRSVRTSLDTDVRTQANIGAAIKAAADKIESSADAVLQLEQALDNILPLYRNCEMKLAGQDLSKTPSEKDASTSAKKEKDGSAVNWSDLVKKMIGAFGDGGGIIAGGYGLITAKNWAEGLNEMIGISGNAAKTWDEIAQNGFNWKKTLGLVEDADALKVTNSVEGLDRALTDYVDGFELSTTKSTGSNIAAAAKWVGLAMNFVTNAVDNNKEFEGTGKTGRAVAETVIEGATDIAVDVAATAVAGVAVGAAASALAAAGVTIAAPGLAIAAASAVVVWGANALCEAAFGKDIGECVADTVCDGAEAIADVTKKAAKAVGKAVGNAAKATKKAAQSAWKRVTGLFK